VEIAFSPRHGKVESKLGMWEERLHQLIDADRERIIQSHADGVTGTDIARRFHVSTATISRILDDDPNGTTHRL
jgi:AraC-like DNA-binding protein